MKEIRIPFKGWDMVAWINKHDGDHRFAVKPMAEAIELDWASQFVKITKDPKFSRCDITMTGADGKQYKMLTLPVRQLNGWLYGINANKVKPEVRQKLLEFQEQCHIHIYNAISGTANAEVVQVLREEIDLLKTVVLQLQEDNKTLHNKIEDLEDIQGIYNSSEQLLASVGGKMMARARKTKGLRH